MSKEKTDTERLQELIDIVNEEISKNREAVRQYERGAPSVMMSGMIENADVVREV